MSGPKISVYSLTETARSIVFGQIRCEQQSLACHARTREIVRSLQAFSGNFDQQIKNIQLLTKRTAKGAGQLEALQALQKELHTEAAEIQRELASHTPHISAKYRITQEAYSGKQAELERLQALQRRAELLQARLAAAFDQDRKNAQDVLASIIRDLEDPNAGMPAEPDLRYLQRDDAHDIQKIQESIVDDLGGVYSFDFEEEAPDTSFQDKKDSIRKQLSEWLRDPCLPESILNEIKRALLSLQRMEDMQRLATFDAITVRGLCGKIERFKREEEQKEAHYKDLLARYEVLCKMAGETPKPPPGSNAAVVASVSAEIDRLERLLVRRQEQAYISECVDEVMADMGYDLIGSREVRKRSGKHFRNKLFTFHEGTAVNVTFSPDGQIAMELGGLAGEDRIPAADETEILTHDMERFCGEFAEFERRMLAKGIVVGSRIALSPPSAAYAAIINVNDYDIAETAQISLLRAAEKRRRQADKKARRNDE